MNINGVQKQTQICCTHSIGGVLVTASTKNATK